MWTWLASFLGGPVVNGLINAYKAKLEAANTEGAQGADLAAKAIAAEIEARARARRRSSSPSRGDGGPPSSARSCSGPLPSSS